jgi:hypothetical protein
MKQNTLDQIKQGIQKVYLIYSKLAKEWNKSENGCDANFPITVIVEVLLQTMAFNGKNCHGYSLEDATKELHSKMELLREIDEFSNKGYMTHFPYKECSLIVEGYSISEFLEEQENDEFYNNGGGLENHD